MMPAYMYWESTFVTTNINLMTKGFDDPGIKNNFSRFAQTKTSYVLSRLPSLIL